MNTKSINCLRWIAVPFAFILTLIISSILGELYVWISFGAHTFAYKVVKVIIVGMFRGAGTVLACTKTAPYNKRTTGIIIATIFTLLFSVSVIACIFEKDWWTMAENLYSIVIAISTASSFYEKDSKNDN